MNRPKDYARPDRHTRAAKAAGYPRAAVFKLEEIHKRYRALQAGPARARSRRAPARGACTRASTWGLPGACSPWTCPEIDQALPPNVLAKQLDVFSAGARGPRRVWAVRRGAQRHGAAHERNQGARSGAELRAVHARARRWPTSSARRAPLLVKLFMSADFAELKRAIVTRYTECRVVPSRGDPQPEHRGFPGRSGRKKRGKPGNALAKPTARADGRRAAAADPTWWTPGDTAAAQTRRGGHVGARAQAWRCTGVVVLRLQCAGLARRAPSARVHVGCAALVCCVGRIVQRGAAYGQPSSAEVAVKLVLEASRHDVTQRRSRPCASETVRAGPTNAAERECSLTKHRARHDVCNLTDMPAARALERYSSADRAA